MHDSAPINNNPVSKTLPRPKLLMMKPVAIIPCCLNRRLLRLFSYNSLELIGNIYSAYPRGHCFERTGG